MALPMPLKENAFKVYLNGTDLLGIADGNFPAIEFATSEIKGAGLAGAIDMPALGQVNSFTVTLNWRTVSSTFMELSNPFSHELDLYSEHLDWDTGRGKYVSRRVHAYMKAVTKKFDAGKLVIGESAEASTEHEVFYYKLDIDGVDMLEIDKVNYIYRVKGIDYLADTRRALGMM